jgi:hypothetical protein
MLTISIPYTIVMFALGFLAGAFTVFFLGVWASRRMRSRNEKGGDKCHCETDL